MKSLKFLATLALVLSQAPAFGADSSVQTISQELIRIYGIQAGDDGVKCDLATGAPSFKAGSVACVSAFFRVNDPVQKIMTPPWSASAPPG